jgi:hypothetical protein
MSFELLDSKYIHWSLVDKLDIIDGELAFALAENYLVMSEPIELPKLGTAQALAMLDDAGWATPAQWRRANKRTRRMAK